MNFKYKDTTRLKIKEGKKSYATPALDLKAYNNYLQLIPIRLRVKREKN